MTFFKKTDLMIIALLLVFSLGGYALYQSGSSQDGLRAEIFFGSELVETIDLEQGIDRVFSVPQDENVIFHQFEDGTIRFEASDCPDQVCVHAGKLKASGDFAACLPNELILKIVRTDGPARGESDLTVN